MYRRLAQLSSIGLFIAIAALGTYLYQVHTSADRKLAEVEQRNVELHQIVQRLQTERRVGDLIVTGQQTGADGFVHTTLLFVEYGRDGSALPGRSFTIIGDTGHIDALVVKFDGKFVEQNDPFRGHSIALFKSIYGDREAPANAQPIDTPGHIPAVYRESDRSVSRFEQSRWSDFWKLADDPAYRAQMGVRVAEGEGVWCPFHPNRLYTLTLESNGGLNITSDPLKGIYRDLMQHSTTAP
jgi:hypothetical protein